MYSKKRGLVVVVVLSIFFLVKAILRKLSVKSLQA